MSTTERAQQILAGQNAYELLLAMLDDPGKVTREEYDNRYDRRYEHCDDTPARIRRKRALDRHKRMVERQIREALSDDEAAIWRGKQIEWVPTTASVTGGGYYRYRNDLLDYEWDWCDARIQKMIRGWEDKLESLRADREMITERRAARATR